MDRLVRRISSVQAESRRHKFSSLVQENNIVLLGEPGSGKTSLFRDQAARMGGLYLTVRSFLNQPLANLSGSSCLYIDALDEKRAGRADSTTVDAIASKLLDLKPHKTRISCRAADWLGDTDLAALNDYYDANGGVVVVALDALDDEEQREILKSHGANDPASFIREAKEKGLSDLLINPQNLVMLFGAVKNGGWPTSKRDLYEKSCSLLLSEHNVGHGEKQAGQFVAEELFDAAGGLLAIRLIGDSDGISLASFSSLSECPSFRQLPVDSIERVQAALSRRAFIRTSQDNAFDYAHRTVAEYLSARWIARRVREGLSITRLMGLLGFDWRPASELRGLYAWLPVFLPEAAQVLIDGDPFGCLAYGDAASLTLSNRKYLLSALARLAEEDPWFRNGEWRNSVAWGLSGADLAPEFSAILSDTQASYSLRSLVLDGINLGQPLYELTPILKKIALDPRRPYAEREDAVLTLYRWMPDSRELYDSLGTSPDDLRLKAELLRDCAFSWAVLSDYATLINQILRLPGRSSAIGSYWSLSSSVPEDLLVPVLDAIRPPRRARRSVMGNRSDAVAIVEQMISRALTQLDPKLAPRLLRWLLMWERLVDRYGGTGIERLRTALENNKAVGDALPVATVEYVDAAGGDIREVAWRLARATQANMTPASLVIAGLEALHQRRVRRRHSVYELVLYNAVQVEKLPPDHLEQIVRLADSEPKLNAIWTQYRVVEVPLWRWEDDERNKLREREAREQEYKRQQEFDKARSQIKLGLHQGWAIWLGQVYCGRFVEFKGDEPKDRLIAALGDERVDDALEALKAAVSVRQPSYSQVLDLHGKKRYLPSWFAHVAGLDLLVQSSDDYVAVAREWLRTAVAIDVLLPSFNNSEGSSSIVQWGWRTLAEQHDPRLVAEVLVDIVTRSVGWKAQYIDGLSDLVSRESLARERAGALRAVLWAYPDASVELLKKSLPVLVNEGLGPKFLNLAMESYEACVASRRYELAMWWAAFGFMHDPQRFQSVLFAHVDRAELLWVLEGLGMYKRLVGEPDDEFVERLNFMVGYALKHFPLVEHPRGGWCGSENPWDASEYIKKAISTISSVLTKRAGECLAEILKSPFVGRYRDYVAHIIAEHNRAVRDARYRQPDWQEARNCLLSSTPSSAADLHGILFDELTYLSRQISGSNTDIYKRFWNEDSYGRVLTPKPEESARDVILDFLRHRLAPLSISVEPEGHMIKDKRADIVALSGSLKAVVELKRDFHAEMWTAVQFQLDRFYTRDVGAEGYGIYGVFWYGDKRPRDLTAMPTGEVNPKSAKELSRALERLVPAADRHRIRVVVLDVSGE